jgi:hypothetical protein
MTTFKGLLEEADRINQALDLSRGHGSYYSIKAQNGVYCLGLFSHGGHGYSQVGDFGPPKHVAAIIRGVLHGIAAAKVWLPGDVRPADQEEADG